jgi:hypothetical protein
VAVQLQSCEQEHSLLEQGTRMKRTQHQATPSGTWRTVFDEQEATLTVVAEMLVPCRISPRKILDQALTALEGSPLRDAFGQISAIRAVVKAAIAYRLKASNSASEAEALLPQNYQFPRIPHIGMLPWPERAAYFLREVLGYSRRDTALLLSISDAKIDQLHKFAEKRIRYFSGASSPLPDASGSSQRLDRIAAWR